ncbi:DNA alkylation repair protein [Candidatus Thioglobus autotrophicus]|uniref:DNA alkylation repair protein n=1 Tax=Candidatus Thioglobus autotrophicus TaxID=1705394 RepID=UPI00299D23CE|nr:DNA alkylation repair protein [Candidatus Thioglobus autotrophicus]WPE18623.1 DNA alkylation repair protein [Candidatus Thioglobus autotrophicus]
MSAQEVITQLKSFASDSRRKSNQYYFKTGPGEYSEFDQFIGVRTPQIRSIAKQYYQQISFDEIDQLINHTTHEIRYCGLIILVYQYQSNNQEAVFNYYLNHLHAVNNWDLVDYSSPHIIGDYLLKHPQKHTLLYQWASSDNLWERRIAIVSTLTFIKQNQFKLTLAISQLLLKDSQDLIHKAVGWMLREVYKKDADTCKIFLRENYAQLPRTTLRYAIERMAEIERKAYLKGGF